jgi:hypothetical protein
MKTIIGMSFILGTVVFSQFSYAGGNLNIGVRSMESKKALVEFSNPVKTSFEISIVDEAGDEIYFKETKEKQNELTKKFDFSNLEDGKYTMKVKTDSGSKENEIMVAGSTVEFGKEITKTHPFFSYKNDQLKLSFLNHQNEELSLHLYNGDELIWSSALENSSVIHKGYDLSELLSGNYQLVLASGNDVYEFDFVR